MVTRIYANAVAKYNEGKLLNAEKLHRIADATFADAVKMLCDYGYGGGTVDEKNYDIDSFISAETAKLIDYALTSAPNEYLSRILTNRFLYGNAKAYYKARATGKSNPAAVYKMPDGEIESGIGRGEYAALPPFMADALRELDILFAEKPADPKTIDIALTKAMYADTVYCAKKSYSKALKNYAAGEIDLANIFTVLRARALGVGETAFADMLVAGGKMTPDRLTAIYRTEEPAALIAESPYAFIAEGNESLSLPLAEARSDDWLLRIWEQQADNMQSLSPFVSYFLAQLGEYKTVKMILTCLKNNARAEILPRLRQVAGA